MNAAARNSTALASTRRAVLSGAAASAALLAVGARGASPSPPGLFTLGVASGEPSPDGMVLWTRLAPQPLLGDGGMPPRSVPVHWEIAEDERFSRLVRSGTARADPHWAHSVHVEVAGLRPARVYYYRFIAGGESSAVGRTRTAPAHDAPCDRLRIAFGSCQKYEVGFYAAYRHMVADDPDLIVFLGDYIYENESSSKSAVRVHGQPEAKDLPGYRIRYATYKLDPLLQAAHHAAPWLTTWDDHEVANDYAGALDERNSDPVAFLSRRAAAYKAYYEHMPLRASARPTGPHARLYRSVDWGRLAQFQIVDDRQYRGPRACQAPGIVAAHQKYASLVAACPDMTDPSRTMLGREQEAWLMGKLGSSRAQWNLLAQQTLMHQQTRIDAEHPERGPLVPADTWSGYPLARDAITRRWAQAGTPNPIALGGDIHAFAAADLHHPDEPNAAPVGTEFVGGSITSLFHDPTLKQQAVTDGIAYAENEVRGYGLLTLRPSGGDCVFRGVDNALRQDSGIHDLVRFRVEAGRPGIDIERG